MSSTRRVVKNASALLISQIITWMMTLVLTLYLPRYLGPENIGKLGLAQALWLIAAAFITFGMDTLLTKEIARRPERAGELLATSLFLRVPLFGLGAGIVLLWSWSAGYNATTILVLLAIGCSQLLWQASATFRATLEGLEQMQAISYAEIISKLFSTAVSLALLLLGFGVVLIASVHIGMAAIHSVTEWHFLRRYSVFTWRFNPQLARRLLRDGVPYLFSSLILVGYVAVDTIVIERFVSEEALGWYNAADRLYAALLFIPAAFIAAVFPVLSRMYADRSNALPLMMRRSFNLMLLLGVPVGIGLAMVAQPLVLWLYGPQFRNSGPVLAVMGIVLMLMYLTILIGRFLISADRQNSWTLVMAFAVVATIALDIVLIPWCQRRFGNGAIGGALAYVVTEGAMLLIGLRMLPPNSLGRSNGKMLARVVPAALLMAAVVWAARDTPLALQIFLGVLVYCIIVLLLGALSSDERRVIYQLLPKKFQQPVGRLQIAKRLLPQEFNSMFRRKSKSRNASAKRDLNGYDKRMKDKRRAMLSDQITDVDMELDLWDDDGHLLMRFPGTIVDNMRHTVTRLTSQTNTLPDRLALVSALPGEGVTYISRALATVMAHDLAARIALVDLNWWLPADPPIAAADNNGLVAVITGEKRLDEIFVRTALPNLTLVPAGALERGDRPIMARSNVLRSAIDVLNEHFDYLIFDLPPIRATNDAVPLATLADGVVLVIRQGVTPIESVRLAIDDIQHLPILGTILNDVRYHTPEFLLRFIPQD